MNLTCKFSSRMLTLSNWLWWQIWYYNGSKSFNCTGIQELPYFSSHDPQEHNILLAHETLKWTSKNFKEQLFQWFLLIHTIITLKFLKKAIIGHGVFYTLSCRIPIFQNSGDLKLTLCKLRKDHWLYFYCQHCFWREGAPTMMTNIFISCVHFYWVKQWE